MTRARSIVLAVVAVLLLYLAFQWLLGAVEDPADAAPPARSSGSGDICITGQAVWSARQKLPPYKALFWAKMPQRVCAKRKTGRQISIGEPVVYQGVTGWGTSVNWRFDGVVGGGFKRIARDATTEVTRTTRIVRFVQCVGPPGIPIGCAAIRSAQVKLKNTFASWPGHIQSASFPTG